MRPPRTTGLSATSLYRKGPTGALRQRWQRLSRAHQAAFLLGARAQPIMTALRRPAPAGSPHPCPATARRDGCATNGRWGRECPPGRRQHSCRPGYTHPPAPRQAALLARPTHPPVCARTFQHPHSTCRPSPLRCSSLPTASAASSMLSRCAAPSPACRMPRLLPLHQAASSIQYPSVHCSTLHPSADVNLAPTHRRGPATAAREATVGAASSSRSTTAGLRPTRMGVGAPLCI